MIFLACSDGLLQAGWVGDNYRAESFGSDYVYYHRVIV